MCQNSPVITGCLLLFWLWGTHTMERRHNPRFACDLEVALERPKHDPVVGQAVDISYSGLCLHATTPVPVGQLAMFHLRLILEWAESETLVLPGRTVWCTTARGGFQIGARFNKAMDDECWSRLDVFLQFLSGDLELEQA